jgi:hypothetical protein
MSDASRISDLDLRGYRGEKPGWFVQRICCMSLAAEIRRMTLDLEPAFDGVRRLLEALQDASKLVGDCPQGHARCVDLLVVVGKSLLWAMPGSEIFWQ